MTLDYWIDENQTYTNFISNSKNQKWLASLDECKTNQHFIFRVSWSSFVSEKIEIARIKNDDVKSIIALNALFSNNTSSHFSFHFSFHFLFHFSFHFSSHFSSHHTSFLIISFLIFDRRCTILRDVCYRRAWDVRVFRRQRLSSSRQQNESSFI
jgi:hypothetical protein